MKNHYILFLFLICFGIPEKNHAQIDAIARKAYKFDTLRINSFAVNFNLLFTVSNDEMNQHTDFKFVNMAQFGYLFNHTDIEINFRQVLERKDNGSFYFNHYLMLSSGVYKYKPLDKKKTMLRTLYPEPLFIFQNNSDRGLQWRFQVGALLHPWGWVRPKFKFNFGIGLVYDWSSWEVNNMEKIDASSPMLREKILFINSRIKLRKDMFQDYSEFRPMLLLNLNYRMNDILSCNLNVSFQQSLRSPYSKDIQEVYPDLKKVYPYILTHFDINVRIYKGISLRFSAEVDYENSNLSLYESSWAYSMMFGGAWSFSNQKIR